MYTRLQLACKYISYYLTASNSRGHGMHSPFVYEFIKKVMNDKTAYPDYEKVERLRKKLRTDDSVLHIEDFGAGSVHNNTQQRSISSIAQYAAKPRHFGQLLYRMVRHYRPQTIIELGTSLGITTSYLALAAPGARIISLEGAEALSTAAGQNLRSLGLTNVTINRGNFDDHLDDVLRDLGSVEFGFVDGNHRQEPTERYFHQMLPYVSNASILVFDDIHWSREMEQAWNNICDHPAVSCTIDLFFIGIVLFRREFKEKQQFRIRF